MMNMEEAVGEVHRRLELLHANIVQGIEELAAERLRTTGRAMQWDDYRQQLDKWLASQKTIAETNLRLAYPLLASLPGSTQVH